MEVLVAQRRLTLCNLMDHARLRCPWDFTGKNTGVGCHFPRQGTVPTQGLNVSPASPALAGRFFTTAPPGKGASLVAQRVKNLPAMQETSVQFLGREDPLEKR